MSRRTVFVPGLGRETVFVPGLRSILLCAGRRGTDRVVVVSLSDGILGPISSSDFKVNVYILDLIEVSPSQLTPSDL